MIPLVSAPGCVLSLGGVKSLRPDASVNFSSFLVACPHVLCVQGAGPMPLSEGSGYLGICFSRGCPHERCLSCRLLSRVLLDILAMGRKWLGGPTWLLVWFSTNFLQVLQGCSTPQTPDSSLAHLRYRCTICYGSFLSICFPYQVTSSFYISGNFHTF